MKNNKSLGQHWLKNRAILDKIADLALVKNAETICIEIGPGLGTLTSSLLRRFREVIAIEYDPGLARNLPKSFPGKSLTVINDDILRVDLSQLVQNSEYIVVVTYHTILPRQLLRSSCFLDQLQRKLPFLFKRKLLSESRHKPAHIQHFRFLCNRMLSLKPDLSSKLPSSLRRPKLIVKSLF